MTTENTSVMLVATNPIDLKINEFYLDNPTAFWIVVVVTVVIGLALKIGE